MAISTSRPTPSTRSPAQLRAVLAASHGKSSIKPPLPIPSPAFRHRPASTSTIIYGKMDNHHNTQYLSIPSPRRPWCDVRLPPAQCWCPCSPARTFDTISLPFPFTSFMHRICWSNPSVSNIDGQYMCEGRLWPVPSECT